MSCGVALTNLAKRSSATVVMRVHLSHMTWARAPQLPLITTMPCSDSIACPPQKKIHTHACYSDLKWDMSKVWSSASPFHSHPATSSGLQTSRAIPGARLRTLDTGHWGLHQNGYGTCTGAMLVLVVAIVVAVITSQHHSTRGHRP